MIYRIGEVLITIYLGYRARLPCVTVLASKFTVTLVTKLIVDGYLSGFTKINNDKQLLIYLKYYESKPIIKDLILVSRPTQRITLTSRKLRLAYGEGYVLILTKSGILTRAEARSKNQGGMVLCQIW